MLRLCGASKEQRLAARYIPKGARRVALKDGSGTVYLYTSEKTGRYFAIAYRGTAGRPEFHYAYRTEAQRNEAVAQFFRGIQQSKEYRAKRQSERSAWTNPLKVGDILHSSWGYDQTNVEFYVVTKVSGRRTWVREIAQDSEQSGFMSGNCWPRMPITPIGEETMHTAQPSGANGVYIKISECIHAWPETGRSHGFSTYA